MRGHRPLYRRTAHRPIAVRPIVDTTQALRPSCGAASPAASCSTSRHGTPGRPCSTGPCRPKPGLSTDPSRLAKLSVLVVRATATSVRAHLCTTTARPRTGDLADASRRRAARRSLSAARGELDDPPPAGGVRAPASGLRRVPACGPAPGTGRGRLNEGLGATPSVAGTRLFPGSCSSTDADDDELAPVGDSVAASHAYASDSLVPAVLARNTDQDATSSRSRPPEPSRRVVRFETMLGSVGFPVADSRSRRGRFAETGSD